MKVENILSESVSISPDIQDDKQDFKDVLSISHFCSKLYWYKILKNYPFLKKHLSTVKFFSFDPDGDDAFEKTGTVNFYIKGGITKHFANDFRASLKDFLQELRKHVEVGPIKAEGAKVSYDTPREPFVKGDDTTKIDVIRIPIIKNEVEPEDIPEMNISNDNARNLFKLLGLNDDELVGTIPHKDIPKMILRIKNYSEQKLQSATRSPYKNDDGPGAKIYDSGVDINRVKGYLSRLEDVLNYAKQKGVDVIYS